MSERLPVHVDPLRLAERGRAISGALPVSACRRLGDWLASSAGELAVDLHFGHDEQARRVMTGRVQGCVKLTCQRCLSTYDLDLDLPLGVVLVENEAQANVLPEDIDALVVSDHASMHTVDMIEDDLILALPLVPRCPDPGDCVTAVTLLDSEQMDPEDTGGQRPFADLDDPDDSKQEH